TRDSGCWPCHEALRERRSVADLDLLPRVGDAVERKNDRVVGRVVAPAGLLVQLAIHPDGDLRGGDRARGQPELPLGPSGLIGDAIECRSVVVAAHRGDVAPGLLRHRAEPGTGGTGREAGWLRGGDL